ncbi:MAG: PKD domain-containing protein, partial [Flavobacteriales bacterium]|nr:PKD domain-containing protein [Flavobacteriales bacterium]
MIRFIVFTIFILPVISFSQNQCGYDFYQKDQIETNPTFEQSIQKRDKDIYNYLTSTNLSKSIDTFGVLHIPVVVHILHFDGDSIIGTGTNITDNKVIDGISELNKAFRNDSAYDSLVGVNVEIQFYLAQVDTCGNPTNGINRIAQSPFVGGGNSFSNATRHSWDPYLYFNIYLVDHISLNGNSYGGLAMGAFGSQLNAVYIVKSYFGYSSGNLSAHEAGHYLSLAHTWINGCKNDNCLLDGDKVCDTPPDNHFNFPYASCNNPGNSCYTDTADTSANNPFRPITLGGIGDQLDQISNYMDYSSSACQIQFTQGQKERMRANLLTEKTTLLGHHANANNCNIPICPYFEISSTGYHYNDFVNEGDTISFNNLSTGATNYHWYIGDSLYSNAQDTIWKPTIPGYHTIKLCGFNSDSNCTRCVFKRLNVNCSAPNAASADKNTLNAGDTVQFSAVHPAQIFPNTTHSFNWYLDSVLISSDTNFTHIFNQPGTYQVRLDVCNTNCCNSRTLTIVVTCNSNIKINAISDTYLNPGDSLKLISNSTS